MKMLRVELTAEDDDGQRVCRVLEGEDAERWRDWVDSVCVIADIHGTNPDWDSLNWQESVRETENG